MTKLLSLGKKNTLELTPKAPFNFDATMHKPDHFPSKDNEWQPGIRWQTMLWQGENLGLKIENKGMIDQPKLVIYIWSRAKLTQNYLDSLTAEINYRYNLQTDLSTFNETLKRDSQLKPIIHKWKGMRPVNFNSLYEYLIIAIVLQNATVRRSVNMMQSLFENYGTLLSFDNKEFYCFWEPEEIDKANELDLRDLKIGYRAKSIKRVTEAFTRNEIDEFQLRTKPLDKQRQTLLRLYGIGPASIGYILFDVFHWWDELSYISPWEQKIYSKLFFNKELTEPIPLPELVDFFERRFSGHKMIAVHYIWEDLFWKRKHENVPWLESLIRL